MNEKNALKVEKLTKM